MEFAGHKINLCEYLFGVVALIGKVNYRNLSWHTQLSEKTFSRQFKKDFDFVRFNSITIDEVVDDSEE